jgi:two-component system response regulator DevR
MTASEQKTISILLVEDHEMTRMGLRSLLNSFSHVTVSGEAETAGDAVQLTRQLKPDVVLLDIRLRNSSGFDACREILKLGLDTRILFLTSFADDEILFEAIASGADGYLLKEISSKALLNAIEEVAAGNSILDPAVTRRVLARFNDVDKGAGAGARFSRLSLQEKRIVNLVTQGRTNKEIAVELGLSPATVKNYLSNAMDKLDIKRRGQVAAMYIQHVQKA